MTQRTFTESDLEELAAATASSTTRHFTEAEQEAFRPAARALFTALADGRPATVEELAAAAGRAPQEIAALLRAVPDVEWDAEGRIAGLGMTLNRTPHQVETNGHRLYTWCAADTLEFLPAIGRTVRISSPCPATGQTVTLTAGPDGVRDLQPPGAVVSAIITGDLDHIRDTVCNLGHFFASAQAASGWAAEHPDGVLLTVPGAFHYARAVMRLSLGLGG